MLNASVYDEANPNAYLDLSTTIGKQSLWVIISLTVLALTLVTDWEFWNAFAYPIYIVTLALLVLVLIIGTEIKGAQSWFSFGGFSIQPSEFAKFGTALALASYLGYFNTDIRSRNALLISLTLFFIPMLLILLQPDAGSALVFLSFFIILYRQGLNALYYILGFALIAIFITSLIFGHLKVIILIVIIANGLLLNEVLSKRYSALGVVLFIIAWYLSYQQSWLVNYIFVLCGVFAILSLLLIKDRKPKLPLSLFPASSLCILFALGSSLAFQHLLEPHQQDRINVWLRPDRCDPQGSLYNIIQSKLAIGSGGFQGKGYLEGTLTKLNYVPEQSTDFIFSIVGEEQGFLGTATVITLFVILLIRIVKIAERAKNDFIKNYAYGVAGIIFVHFFINIGMSVGLMPVIGIPLPFLSKGGSALLGFTLLIGVLLKMDLARLRV